MHPTKKDNEMNNDIDLTLNEREATHGDFSDVASVAQSLKFHMDCAPYWGNLTDDKKEALQMIALKVARIVCGNPNDPDHWKDIEGYARLVRDRIAPDD